MFNSTSSLGPPPPIERYVRPDLFSCISDKHLALAAPVVVYWVFSMFFHVADVNNWFEKFRLHTPEELLRKNRCSELEVIRAVVVQHLVQTLAGLVLDELEGPQYSGYENYEIWCLQKNMGISRQFAWTIYYVIGPFFRILLGFFIMDTWQYALHRLMHQNQWLYRHFHSVHHRLYVPYAFGALYNSLIEGLLLDTSGAGLSYTLTGMSTREAILFYSFSTMKTVDDHCGYQLPYDPFQLLFPNNAAYHDIHHQQFGIKTNFSQPFFVHWDELFGTKFKFTKKYIEDHRRLREDAYKHGHEHGQQSEGSERSELSRKDQ